MQNSYRTKDLFEAAFLYASNQRFLGLETNDKQRYWFLFEDDVSCCDLISLYWNKEATIGVRDFVDALRAMKDKVFQEK